MIEAVSPEDRVLVLSLADRREVRSWARAHLLVGLGSDEDVAAARREFADLDNVMFVVGDRGHIPWQDRFFTVVVDEVGLAPNAEILRCLADNGRVVSAG